VTLNLVPDDETGIKGKTVMRWDSKKKRHILMKVDRDGRVIKEKRNESGAKITKKKAEESAESQKIYKKWMKKTHMKLQSVGEVENSRAVEMARNNTEGRKMMKQFKSRHGAELNRGEDPRSNDHIIKMKKKQLMDKMKNGHANKNSRKGGPGA